MTDNTEEEILKMFENGDCPSELLDLLDDSQSKWRKGVIKEFIINHLWKKNVENKLKWISREQKAIIGLLLTLITIALKFGIFGGI